MNIIIFKDFVCFMRFLSIRSNKIFTQLNKGESPNPYKDAPPVIPEQYGYHWIDFDEYYQSLNGLNSIGGIPEELEAKD